MFQFTTTTVINSQQDLTTGLPLWSLKEAGDDSELYIKRLGNFKKANVVNIYKAEANDPINAKAIISLDGIDAEKGDTLRLFIYIGLSQASQESLYSNDLVFKGKPLSIDFVYDGDATTTLEKLVKIINKYQLNVYGKKILKISNAGAELTIEAIDEFKRFAKLSIDKFLPEAYHGMGDYVVLKGIGEGIEEVQDVAEVAADTYFNGKEGFGTYSYLLRNLRLPTHANTSAFSVGAAEAPIVGAKYNQYTIHYCVKRGILGMNAVGEVTKSLTTHVLYVNQDLLGKVPEGELSETETANGVTLVDIEGALNAIHPDGAVVSVPEVKTTDEEAGA